MSYRFAPPAVLGCRTACRRSVRLSLQAPVCSIVR
jgi:hypothetical protein